MDFWEPATHMSKTEWRAACERTLQDYPSLRYFDGAQGRNGATAHA